MSESSPLPNDPDTGSVADRRVSPWRWLGRIAIAATTFLLVLGYLLAGLSDPDARTLSSTPVKWLPSRADNNASQSTSIVVADVEADSTFAETQDLATRRWKDHLADRQLQAAADADWLTVCRRQSLALVGAHLSLEEIRHLQSHPEEQRTQMHLQGLLDDRRFHDYWAERWARLLVGNDEGEFVTFRRRRFRVWLSEFFSDPSHHHDDLVRSVVASEGLWTDHPEVNFITATFDSNGSQPDPVRLAARTSRVFLGLRIDCLQCHDDFLGNVSLGDEGDRRGGMQHDFHQLAAFYSSATNNGLQGVKSGQADYDFKYLHEDEESAVPAKVPYGSEYLQSTGNPRHDLAEWIVHPRNRQAARATVSHVWALMFGQPDGEAVDNLPLDEPSGPVLETFVDDFIANDFDYRRLIRLVATSQPFTRASQADFEITQLHESEGATFPLVPLRSEQVAGSLLTATRVKTVSRDSSFLVQLINLTTGNEFITRYGDLGEEELKAESVTIPQRLLMMNGKLSRESIRANPFLAATSHLSMFSNDRDELIDNAYLCVLNRDPEPSEREAMAELFEGRSDERAMEDLFWVLINSSEFVWNH